MNATKTKSGENRYDAAQLIRTIVYFQKGYRAIQSTLTLELIHILKTQGHTPKEAEHLTKIGMSENHWINYAENNYKNWEITHLRPSLEELNNK